MTSPDLLVQCPECGETVYSGIGVLGALYVESANCSCGNGHAFTFCTADLFYADGSVPARLP